MPTTIRGGVNRFSESFLASWRHACARPHSLADRETGSTFTCVLEPCLFWQWCKAKRWLGYFGASFARDPRKMWQKPAERGCKVPRIGPRTEQSLQAQVERANDSDCFRLTLLQACQPGFASATAAATMAPESKLETKGHGDGVAEDSRKIIVSLAKIAFSGSRNFDRLPYRERERERERARVKQSGLYPRSQNEI